MHLAKVYLSYLQLSDFVIEFKGSQDVTNVTYNDPMTVIVKYIVLVKTRSEVKLFKYM